MRYHLHTIREYTKLLVLSMATVLLLLNTIISGHLRALDCAEGWSSLDCQALLNDWVDWVPDNCGQAVIDFGKLDNMTIPDDLGKFAQLPAIDKDGHFIDDPSHGSIDPGFAKLAGTLDDDHRNYYIAMRWNYSEWNWDGSHTTIDTKEETSMQSKPRMVTITDTQTGKSVVATALDVGPAPWMGVDEQPNNIPKQGWIDPQIGTPTAYDGDIAGLSPAAVTALNDPDNGNAKPGAPDGTGDRLKFQWTSDQTAKPGSIDLGKVDDVQTCTQGTGPGNVVFISQRDPKWAGQYICWGGLSPSQCSHVLEGGCHPEKPIYEPCGSVHDMGCWASSAAMIISTLGNRGFVTPMQTEGTDPKRVSFDDSGLTVRSFDPVNGDIWRQALDALRSGSLLFVHGTGEGPDGGPFYGTRPKGNHWEVIRGVSSDGSSILLDDPWDLPDPNNPSQPVPTGHTLKTWPMARDVLPYVDQIRIVTKKQA